MLIERNGFRPDPSGTRAKLRENCLGCKDCDGPCRALIQMLGLSESLLGSKGANH